MVMIYVVAVLAAFIAGFAAGASPAPTGGAVCSAIGSFIIGLFAGFVGKDAIDEPRLFTAGTVGTVSLGTLLISYVVSNVLRSRGLLSWMGIRGSKA